MERVVKAEDRKKTTEKVSNKFVQAGPNEIKPELLKELSV